MDGFGINPIIDHFTFSKLGLEFRADYKQATSTSDNPTIHFTTSFPLAYMYLAVRGTNTYPQGWFLFLPEIHGDLIITDESKVVYGNTNVSRGILVSMRRTSVTIRESANPGVTDGSIFSAIWYKKA